MRVKEQSCSSSADRTRGARDRLSSRRPDMGETPHSALYWAAYHGPVKSQFPQNGRPARKEPPAPASGPGQLNIKVKWFRADETGNPIFFVPLIRGSPREQGAQRCLLAGARVISVAAWTGSAI